MSYFLILFKTTFELKNGQYLDTRFYENILLTINIIEKWNKKNCYDEFYLFV